MRNAQIFPPRIRRQRRSSVKSAAISKVQRSSGDAAANAPRFLGGGSPGADNGAQAVAHT